MSDAGPDKLARWQGVIPEAELAAYRAAGFGQRVGFGRRAALVNIDTTWIFVDPKYAMCGHEDPALIANLRRLTAAFRRLGLPIYYSRRDDRSHPTRRGLWNLKLAGQTKLREYTADPRADKWPEGYAPTANDVTIAKGKPSVFFGTPLIDYIRYDRVDTVVLCGVTISGCVRAAAVDAFSHNLRVIVAEEACGDRSPWAGRLNLFDMDMKFADVEPVDRVIAEIDARYAPRAAALSAE